MAIDRVKAVELIEEAMGMGARCQPSCRILGISKRTFLRWRNDLGGEDRRSGPKEAPAHALSEEERALVLAVATSPKYRDLSPAQIVPQLADTGIYIASESSFYRILRSEQMVQHRERAKPVEHTRPSEHEANGPNEVWSWDITFLKSPIRGMFYYLYMVVDVWSRKIVGWAVHESESAELSKRMILNACKTEGIDPNTLVLHSDNGAAMKGATLLATLQQLGIVASFSRPRVCDDNPYSEALFRTMKYVPEYPALPFTSREDAETWVEQFVRWYNHEHLHSGIKFITPESRHAGADSEILRNRTAVYEQAKQAHPKRWSGGTRNWQPVETVILNKRKENTAETIPIERIA